MTKIYLFIILLLVAGCAAVPEFNEYEWQMTVEETDESKLYAVHIDDNGIFFNPWLVRTMEMSLGKLLQFRMQNVEIDPLYDQNNYSAVFNNYDYLKDDVENITFAGHASFIIKMDNQTIFTDPFFSNRAFLAPATVKLNFDFEKVPYQSVVLISHNHYDHLDEYSLKELIKKEAIFIVPLKLKDYFVKMGAKEVYELDWWESVELNGITYTFLPAQHWSRRLWQDVNSVLWGSFMMEGGKTIYYSGDTGYFKGFREFGKKYSIDYAILAAGAYLPRWMMHYSHQNIDEFFKAVDDLKAKKVIPMHFGTIELGKEPLLYPLFEIDNYIKNNAEYGDIIVKLKVGEFTEIK